MHLGSWGCGAYYNTKWLQYQWFHLTQGYDITAKELLPIVFAAAIWGKEWEEKPILCRCDNEAVVNTGTSRNPVAMGLMCCLFFISAKYNLLLSAAHIAGTANGLADALSRNNLPSFLSNYPQANPLGTTVPDSLVNLLVGSKPDWTSPSWSSMFSSIFNHNPQCAPTRSVPTSEPVLCQFVSFLATEQLKHTTIKSYLSSIRFFQILQCGTDPFIRDLPRLCHLTYVLRGIKSEEVKKDNRAQPRLPLTLFYSHAYIIFYLRTPPILTTS